MPHQADPQLLPPLRGQELPAPVPGVHWPGVTVPPTLQHKPEHDNIFIGLLLNSLGPSAF